MKRYTIMLGLVTIILMITCCRNENTTAKDTLIELEQINIDDIEESVDSSVRQGDDDEYQVPDVTMGTFKTYIYIPPYNVSSFDFQGMKVSKESYRFNVEVGAKTFVYPIDSAVINARITMISVSGSEEYVAIEIDESNTKKVWIIDVESDENWVVGGTDDIKMAKSPMWNDENDLLLIAGNNELNNPVVYTLNGKEMELVSTYGDSGEYFLPSWNNDANGFNVIIQNNFISYSNITFSEKGDVLASEPIDLDEINHKNELTVDEEIYFYQSDDGSVAQDLNIDISSNEMSVTYKELEMILPGHFEEQEIVGDISVSTNKEYVFISTGGDNIYPKTWLLNLKNGLFWRITGVESGVEIADNIEWGPNNIAFFFASNIEQQQPTFFIPTDATYEMSVLEDVGDYQASHWTIDGEFVDCVKVDEMSNGYLISRYAIDNYEKIYEEYISGAEYKRWLLAGIQAFE